MNDTEDLLRDVLDDWASGVSAHPALADAVLARARRGQRRRRALVSALAAVVILAGAGVFWVLAPWRADTEAADRLVPAAPPRSSDSAPPSPVDFGWLPDQFSAPTADLLGPGAWIFRVDAQDPPATLMMTVSPVAPPTTVGTGKTGTTTVDGATATTYSVPPHEVGAAPYGTTPPDADGATEEITFQRKPEQWIRINVHVAGGTTDMGVTGDDVRRIGESLVDRERRVPDLLHIDGFEGVKVVTSSYDTMSGAAVGLTFASEPTPEGVWRPDGFGPKTDPPVNVYLGSDFAIGLYAGPWKRDPVERTIPAKNGTIILKRDRSADRRTAVVQFPGGQVGVVLVPKSMSEADLVALAGAITPGEDYSPVVSR